MLELMRSNEWFDVSDRRGFQSGKNGLLYAAFKYTEAAGS